MSSTNAGVPLYPNWVIRSNTKSTGHDAPNVTGCLKKAPGVASRWMKELDADSMLDPLQLAFQSSQPDSQAAVHQISLWEPKATDATTLQ